MARSFFSRDNANVRPDSIYSEFIGQNGIYSSFEWERDRWNSIAELNAKPLAASQGLKKGLYGL